MRDHETRHDGHARDDPGPSPTATQHSTSESADRTVRRTLTAREADWEFEPGRPVRAWTYDGRVPGPLLEAHVGDMLEVRFENMLREQTIVHWHGLRIPATMDGTLLAQRPVGAGESFLYRLSLPDAGTFWYHPHLDEPEQVGHGLYGALIVRGEREPMLDAERVLVLADVTLDTEGRFVSGARRNGTGVHTIRLVNGESEPTLSMRAGQMERWRIVNAASARYLRLRIGGRPFRLIASGGGLLEAPVEVAELVLVPGDRADVVVGPFSEETSFDLTSRSGSASADAEHSERFASVVVGPAAPSRAHLPARLRTIEPLADASAAPTRTIHLGSRSAVRPEDELLINRRLHLHDDDVQVGRLQVWDLVNDGAWDHPFHLHGFFFQILARDGVPPAFPSWEDTVDVPAGSWVRIAWMPDDRPGEWMYHCHILPHHAAGMMAHFRVVR
jgi:FtsP/CotA-like multicopper oxidase with cupredoxin domain